MSAKEAELAAARSTIFELEQRLTVVSALAESLSVSSTDSMAAASHAVTAAEAADAALLRDVECRAAGEAEMAAQALAEKATEVETLRARVESAADEKQVKHYSDYREAKKAQTVSEM